MTTPLSPEQQVIKACLDARDAIHAARRLADRYRRYHPAIWQAFKDAEDSCVVAINIQQELRTKAAEAQRVAA